MGLVYGYKAIDRAWRGASFSAIRTKAMIPGPMVQDSITDHIDTAREDSSHLNFTYRMTIIFAEIVPWYVTNPSFFNVLMGSIH